MRNRYAGTCYRCGGHVAPGAGHFERIPFNKRAPGAPKWRTQHAECAIQHRGTDKRYSPPAALGRPNSRMGAGENESGHG